MKISKQLLVTALVTGFIGALGYDLYKTVKGKVVTGMRPTVERG